MESQLEEESGIQKKENLSYYITSFDEIRSKLPMLVSVTVHHRR